MKVPVVEYDAISIGYPGNVRRDGPTAEPGNLASGWLGFDFARAFSKPVRIINDAAMQALGAYDGGRMLFLGLGTGVGSTLVTDAENDQVLLRACGLAVAVANALPSVKAHADLVTEGAQGAGVVELIGQLLSDALDQGPLRSATR